MKKYLLIGLTSLLLFISCEKEKPTSSTNLLVGKEWIYSNPFYAATETIIFNSDNTYKIERKDSIYYESSYYVYDKFLKDSILVLDIMTIRDKWHNTHRQHYNSTHLILTGNYLQQNDKITFQNAQIYMFYQTCIADEIPTIGTIGFSSGLVRYVFSPDNLTDSINTFKLMETRLKRDIDSIVFITPDDVEYEEVGYLTHNVGTNIFTGEIYKPETCIIKALTNQSLIIGMNEYYCK